MPDPGSERRLEPRFMSAGRCWCQGEAVTLLASLGNVSRGGFFLKTSNPLAVGQTALLSFKPDGGHEVVARAEVVWRRPSRRPASGPAWLGMGLKLVEFLQGRELFGLYLQRFQAAGRPTLIRS